MAIIPAERRATWIHGTTVGVPGGKAQYASRPVSRTADAATYGNGVTYADNHLIELCTAADFETVIYLPPGIYRIPTPINFQRLLDGKTLRGAGGGQTVIKIDPWGPEGGDPNNEGHQAVIKLGPGQNSPHPPLTPGVGIVTGAAGSSTVTCSNTTGLAVWKCATIIWPNETYEIHKPQPENQPRMFGFHHLVTAINGDQVTLWPPVIADLTGKNADIVPWTAANPIFNTGIEGITFDKGVIPDGWVGTKGPAIAMQSAFGCWVSDCEVLNNWRATLVSMYLCIGCEVTGNKCLSSTSGGGAGTEGTWLDYSSANLIENNLFVDAGFPAICLGNGAGNVSGNVIAYNLSIKGHSGDDVLVSGLGISTNHTPHCAFNLIEGNITEGIMDDGYHGSGSHNTYHRNWCVLKTVPTYTSNMFGFNMARWSNYENIVGNVIGAQTGFDPNTMGILWTGHQLFMGERSNNNPPPSTDTFGPTTPPNYRTFQPDGVNMWSRDLNVRQTVMFHGNYVPAGIPSGQLLYEVASQGQQWDPGVADHALLDSYYTTKAELEARGVVWGSKPFPPFDPANPPTAYTPEIAATLLPAADRWVNGEPPPPNPSPAPPLRSARAPKFAIPATP
jgi:hypothetical protein